jgi:hypothetical protein
MSIRILRPLKKSMETHKYIKLNRLFTFTHLIMLWKCSSNFIHCDENDFVRYDFRPFPLFSQDTRAILEREIAFDPRIWPVASMGSGSTVATIPSLDSYLWSYYDASFLECNVVHGLFY